jgi:hypothetical protein
MRAVGPARGSGRRHYSLARRPCPRAFLRSRRPEQMRCSSALSRSARRLRHRSARPSPVRRAEAGRAAGAGRPEFRLAEAEVRPQAEAAPPGVVGAEAGAAAVEVAVEAAAAAQPAEAGAAVEAGAEAEVEAEATGVAAEVAAAAEAEAVGAAGVVAAAEAEAEGAAGAEEAGAALRPAQAGQRRRPRTQARRELAATAGVSSPHPYNVRGGREVAPGIARD